MNNNVLDHIWWIFYCEGQNGGNDDGNMIYDYGLDHGELGEHFLVLKHLSNVYDFTHFKGIHIFFSTNLY